MNRQNFHVCNIFWGKKMAKLEKNKHKTGTFLTIFKKEGATITATFLLYHLLQSNYIKAKKVSNRLSLYKSLDLPWGDQT